MNLENAGKVVCKEFTGEIRENGGKLELENDRNQKEPVAKLGMEINDHLFFKFW